MHAVIFFENIHYITKNHLSLRNYKTFKKYILMWLNYSVVNLDKLQRTDILIFIKILGMLCKIYNHLESM